MDFWETKWEKKLQKLIFGDSGYNLTGVKDNDQLIF